MSSVGRREIVKDALSVVKWIIYAGIIGIIVGAEAFCSTTELTKRPISVPRFLI